MYIQSLGVIKISQVISMISSMFLGIVVQELLNHLIVVILKNFLH
jgi:hypothetical protein